MAGSSGGQAFAGVLGCFVFCGAVVYLAAKGSQQLEGGLRAVVVLAAVALCCWVAYKLSR